MRWKTAALVLGALLVAGGAWLLILRLEREAPTIIPGTEPRFIGIDTPLSFVVEDKKSGLRALRVWVKQGERLRELASEDFPSGGWLGGGTGRRELELRLQARTMELEQGPATVSVAAQDHSWWAFRGNRAQMDYQVTVDTVPPRIDLLSTAHNVSVGGAGVVAYRLSEEAGSTGVEVGDLFFTGYPEKSGGARAWVAYFALAHDLEPGIKVVLTAADPAGNVARRTFPINVKAKAFPRDAIELTDSFLEAKMPEFNAVDPSLGADRLETFLKVNRDWRIRDHRKLEELSRRSRPERLWSGAFVQMRNTQRMARYAEGRTYVYQGRTVDQQTHLGLDLASTAGASVPAANSGEVAYAGDLGIYGQAVVLDHGQGLQSLYAHLSGISVNQGQKVAKGEILGASGQTGMAGGDHLHFSTLVGGRFTDPLEWLDQHWIDDNVASKLDLFAAP